jgi:hypothetical protein
MASTAPIPSSLLDSRRRSFFLPREHGGWGMLLVPLVTGAATGGPNGIRLIWIFLLAVAALGLFCLRTPVESALQIAPLRPQNDDERRLVYHFIFIYSFVSVLALTLLIVWAHAYGLLRLGAATALAFLLPVILKRLGRHTRMNSQLAGGIALSSTAGGAYYLATGHFGAAALLVWLVNWLFAADQIHFVQLRLHSARAMTPGAKLRLGKGFLVHQALTLLLLVLVWRAGWLPGLILVAFAPLSVRGLAWILTSPRRLQVRRLGATELLYALTFGLIFITGSFHPIG